MKLNLIDRAIAAVSPATAVSRAYNRELLSSYRAGVQTRSDRSWTIYGSNYQERLSHRESIASMRSRARRLERNNAIARSALDRAVENVVGVGIRVEPRTDDIDFNKEVKERWKQWTNDCEVRGLWSFDELCRLLYRSKLRDGDCGVILVTSGGFPRLQAIEGQNIATPIGRVSDEFIEDGVEFNRLSRPIRYHISAKGDKGASGTVGISARDFIHIARHERLTGFRGVSSFSTTFALYDALDGYIEATTDAARAAALFGLLIKKENAAFFQKQNEQASDGARQIKLQAGLIGYLNPGETVEQVKPEHPTTQFDAFVSRVASLAALPLGLTMEQVLLDFTKTNYSSSRAARLQAQATAYQEQQHFYNVFLRRVYQWWLSTEINAGRIVTPTTLVEPVDYWKHEWIPQGRPWVDPTKEIQAAVLAMQNNLETHSNILVEQGYDPEEMFEQIAKDQQKMREAGIEKPAATSSPSAPQPQDNSDEDQEDDQPSNADRSQS